ncbi:MAG: polysaccharide biosynthesis protein [Bacteroidales bacterium]|nr:polysaccharide biosynthesis protein [Bacteroidales bacterium]
MMYLCKVKLIIGMRGTSLLSLGKNFVKKMSIAPSWVIFLIDTLCVCVAALFALILRDNFHIPANFYQYEYYIIPLSVVVVRMISFLIFKTHKIVVRYTNTRDIYTIFLCCLSGTLFIAVLNVILFFIHSHFLVPFSILCMEFFITLVLMILYRFTFKIFYLETVNPAVRKKNVVIYGAGLSGITTKRALDRDIESRLNVCAFFDEDPTKIGKKLEDVEVLAYNKLGDYLQKNDVSFLIIAIQGLPNEKKNEVTECALQHRVKVLVVPPVNKWINNELSFKQIKKVKIEELLERDPIVLDKESINQDICGQTILITGAAGSIGSEIVRQLMQFNYARLILVDNAETPVFFLKNECMAINHLKDMVIEIASVTDEVRMEELFAQYKPNIVYHAAAYKHVPLMEENVNAAIKTNVLGTKILADLAVKYGVKKFVMISTDKAVNPTNVMGASKRIAEIYVQSLNNHQQGTKFITTRFGNVLDSNGSVIPIFRKQIAEGGPVTVTHPDITRYFMTISEACQLVINAGAIGNGGEIFIFDMGKSVRIYDLAVKMIKLSGLTLDKDIKIEFTGLRPGEKLYEELLANQENTIRTDYRKILIAKVRTYEYDKVAADIDTLISYRNDDPYKIVKKMKELVPEFKSNNSVFEVLNN